MHVLQVHNGSNPALHRADAVPSDLQPDPARRWARL